MASRLVVAGPPGAGKTTVGRLLAEQLGFRFLDTDEAIAERCGLSVAELFATRGEAAFRAEEAALIAELVAAPPERTVIATGGGLPVDPAVRRELKRLGPCVCLHASLDELVARLGPAGETRPLLAGEARARLEPLLAARAPAYRDLHYFVDTTGRPPESVAALLASLGRAEAERLPVRHPGGSYDLVLGEGLLAHLGRALGGRGFTGPIAILTDENVGPLYGAAAVRSLRDAGLDPALVSFPAGEASKRLSTVERLGEELALRRVERGGAVVALGGGVVGDVAGLVAATYQRGVALIQVPTTLLAMADSSIGGKVGVDLAQGKNLIGAFKQPELVLIDRALLRTLPAAEYAAGLAEVVKAGLLGGGAGWAAVRALRDAPRAVPGLAPGPVLATALHQALLVKRALVEQDPYEAGPRALLNLGHTFGHAIEAALGYTVRHGEAVAVGLVAAAELSARRGLLDRALVAELRELLGALELPTTLAALPTEKAAAEGLMEQVLGRLSHDKKRRAGRVRFVLLRAPGDAFLCDDVDEDEARAALAAVTG
jgi:3-dehydroquinate synthase